MKMSKEEAKGHRRSARIMALEEKARMLSLQKKTKDINPSTSTSASTRTSSPAAAAARKRGRKRKSLIDVDVTHQEGEDAKPEDTSITNANLSSPQHLPTKQTLEFVLDILQRRDINEIFAQPVDSKKVIGYYNIIKEPMDFGTMRAKLQEGMYTSLEQFERDVFLISSNAMKFNASTTVYYAEARAISELAQQVFHALRTKPEKFELKYSRTRRRSGRKIHDEAGGSHSKLAKPDGVALNGPSLRRTTQTYLASSRPTPGIDQVNNKIPSGSRGGRSLNSSETEKRLTYIPQTSSLRKNELTVSTVYNAPKPLQHVMDPGTQYTESLKQFVKDLGPTAQMVANKKLGKCPIEAQNYLSLTPTSFGSHTDHLVPTPSALQGAAHVNGANCSQMPHSLTSSSPGSYKGKMVNTNGKITIHNGFEGERTPPRSGLQRERAHTTNGGHLNCALLGQKAAETSRNLDVCGSSKEKVIGTSDNMDLLIATVMQISAIQNRNAHTASGSYYPLTGHDLHVYQPSQFTESQPWLPNNYSKPMSLPSQTTKISSVNQTTVGSCFPRTGNVDLHIAKPSQFTESRPWMPNNYSKPMSMSPQTAKFSSTDLTTAGSSFPHSRNEDLHIAKPSQFAESQLWPPNNYSKPVSLPLQTTKVLSTNQTTAGSDFSHVGKEDLHIARPSQFTESQPWLLNNYSKQMSLPSQTTKVSITNQTTAGLYFSRIGKEDLLIAKPPQFTESQPLLLNNYSKPMSLPSQTTKVSSMNQTTASLCGFGTQYPNGEGPSSAAASALDYNYGTKSVQAVQPVEWSQPTPWTLQAICELPFMQTQVNEQTTTVHDAFMQQQSHAASTQEIPLFDTMSFLEGANSQGHQAGSSAQWFWDTPQSSLMDNGQPDLALQL